MKTLATVLSSALLSITLMAACSNHSTPMALGSAAPPTQQPPYLIICTSNLDNSVVKYYSNEDTPKPSTFLPGVTIHYIIETNGQHITLNSLEFKNYNCVKN